MSKATTIKILTPDEARRALYVDFEGRMKSAPVLLGCARRSGIEQIPHVWQAVSTPTNARLGFRKELGDKSRVSAPDYGQTRERRARI